MPGDLLRFISGPTAYSGWWLWLAITLLLVVIVWYAAVFVVTLPNARLRELPALGHVHAKLMRRRFAGTIRHITDRHRRGELNESQAYDQMTHTVRSFLHQATGIRAQYLQVDEIAAGALAPAAALIAALRDARFDSSTDTDPDRLGAQAEELIRSWT